MARAGRFGRAARAGSATRRWSAAVHRWLALVVGLLLLFEFVSGTVLLYRPELFAMSHPALFAGTPTAAPLTAGQAEAAVTRAQPDFAIGNTTWVDGVWQVTTPDYDLNAYVDPGTGAVLGTADPQGGVLGFLMNLHDCALSCEGYAGYVPAMGASVPGLGGELTWAGLVIGVIGLAFAVLALSGLTAWWPSMRRFAKAVRTKLTPQLRRGHYRANRDLHDVAAIVALPLLVVWAVTGAGYELPFVGDAWYAVTGGEEQAQAFTPSETAGPDIGPDAAVVAARGVLPGQELVSVSAPTADDPENDFYLVGFQTGPAPARYGGLRAFSESSVAVDRHTGRAELYAGGAQQSWSDWLWTSGNYGAHFGYIVPWWARLLWFAAGLVTLYLVGSGFWTWWWRRRLRRRRARTPAPVAAEREKVPSP